MTEPAEGVLVRVFPVDEGREIGWGADRVAAFRDRLGDVRGAMVSGARAIAASLDDLPSAKGWRLHQVTGSFGISLATEGGAIITKATAGTTFEVTVIFERESHGSSEKTSGGSRE